MSSARIGIVCNRLAKGGGMESHALGLVAEFSALGMMPVISTKNHLPLEQLAGLEVHSCPTKLMPRPAEDVLFRAWLRRAKAKAGVSACIGFCRNTESDLLLCGGTHRGFCLHKEPETRKSLYDRVTIGFEERAYGRVRFILPASRLIASELRELYTIEETRIRIAYPPVPRGKFACRTNEERRRARAALGLSPDKTVLLFPSASGHERKGLPLILECLKGLTHIQLAVAGKPAAADNQAVVSIGYQTDMATAYNAADYTILASSYEPFGLVGVESVLCGTPTIFADTMGCTEVLSQRACRRFSHSDPESLRSILRHLKPGGRTDASDISYDYSAGHQAQMLLSLLDL